MKDFLKLIEALLDPNRVKIVKTIQTNVVGGGEMATIPNLIHSTICRHLKFFNIGDNRYQMASGKPRMSAWRSAYLRKGLRQG